MSADISDLELAVELAKAGFDPNLHPRDPHSGEFTRVPGAGGGGSEEETRLRLADERKILYGQHEGTPDDPVPCGGDIERAARVLENGGHVTLNQPDEVATLLDKLRDIVKEAEAKGEKAPNYDLCNVSVPGTNLFCQDEVKRSDGTPIERVQMPQLSTKDPVPGSEADKMPRNKKGEVDLSRQFGEFLASSGRATTNTTIDASHLRASQSELNGGKVAGIAGAVAAGKIDVNDPKGAIYVTRDNYVIDGHHRWAAYVAESYRTGETIDMPVIVVDTDIGEALTLANFWTEEMGIPAADVTKKSAPTAYDPKLYAAAIDTPELLEIIGKFAEELHPRDSEGRWTETGGGDGKHFDEKGDAHPTTIAEFRAYLEANDWKMYHATSAANAKTVLEVGLLSAQDQGEAEPTDEEWEDYEEEGPYSFNGVYLGSIERAEIFGDTIVAIDMHGMEDRLDDFTGLGQYADPQDTQAEIRGSVSPDRLSIVPRGDVADTVIPEKPGEKSVVPLGECDGCGADLRENEIHDCLVLGTVVLVTSVDAKFSETQPRDEQGQWTGRPGETAGRPDTPTDMVHWTRFDDAATRLTDAQKFEGQHVLAIMRSGPSHSGDLHVGATAMTVGEDVLDPQDVRQIAVYGNWTKARGDASSLIRWFNEGAGGAIAWGAPGDWAQCVAIASAHMGVEDAKGFCQNRHQDATGMSTAEHAQNDGKAGDFTPSLHPRDEHGRFTDSGGGGAPLAGAAVPPLPGETPIPPGTVRLFHITPLRNAEAISQQGLRMSTARGESYGEPNQIWANAGTDSQQAKRVIEGGLMDSDFAVVEFWARPEELSIGSGVPVDVLERQSGTVTMWHDVPPEQIVAVHEPWHAAYRYLSDYKDEVNAGDFDNFLDDPQFPGYARAIEMIKQGKAFTETLHPRYPAGTPGGLGGQFMPEGGGDSGLSLADEATGRVPAKGGFHEGEQVMLRGGKYGTIVRIDDAGAHVEVHRSAGIQEVNAEGIGIYGSPMIDTHIIPMDFVGPVQLMYHAELSDYSDDSGRTYAVTYTNATLEQVDAIYGKYDPLYPTAEGRAEWEVGREPFREQFLETASVQLDDMYMRNRDLEADTGLTNAWTGEMHLGVNVGSQQVGAVGTKDWESSISFDVKYMSEVMSGATSPESAAMIYTHELAHGLSTGAVPEIYEPQVYGNRTYEAFSQSDAYRRDPGFEEGVVQGYVEAKAQVERYGPGEDYDTWIEGHGAYRTWVNGLDEALRISKDTDPDQNPATPTTQERLDYYRNLITTPLPARQDTVNELIGPVGYHLTLSGKGLGSTMTYDLAYTAPSLRAASRPPKAATPTPTPIHDLIFTAETPQDAREILPTVDAYLATDPDDYLEVARDAEALVMLATSDMPRAKAGEFTERLHPRDSHGRFAEAGGADLTRTDYEGQVGNTQHITAIEEGHIPTAAVRDLRGVMGERPGDHRNIRGEAWEEFKQDIAANGIKSPIFITVDHGEEPKISEGNHRRDAAVELGMDTVPVEIRYFGHAEQEGTVSERYSETAIQRELRGNVKRRAEEARANDDQTSYGRGTIFVAEHGRMFELSDKKPPPGEPGFCSYNVGRALDAGLPKGWSVAAGYWAGGSGHTWLVDAEGKAVDSTATRAQQDNPRFGVEIPLDVAIKHNAPVDEDGAKETGSRWEFAYWEAVADLADTRGAKAGEFTERLHPRDERGRFAEVPGSGDVTVGALVSEPTFGSAGAPYRTTFADLPDKVYHVAPASEHDSIASTGLDAAGHSWNWGISAYDQEHGGAWNPTTQSFEGTGSDTFGYRPEGVYVFPDAQSAVEYQRYQSERGGAPFEIYEIDAQALGNLPPGERPDVLRDPEMVQAEQSNDLENDLEPRSAEEIFDELRSDEDENGDERDSRSWVIDRVPSEFAHAVKPYELKDPSDWDENDYDDYSDDHPEVAAWEDFPFDERKGEGPRAGDTPPERTPEGDFVMYHSTSPVAAASIVGERTIQPDDFNAVGLATTPEAARIYGIMKAGADAQVLRVTVSQEWLSEQRAQHEIGGSGHDQFLIQPAHGSSPEQWEGLPPDAIVDIRPALTEADDYRKTWKPVMTPEDGHAWAEAADTKIPQTVVHMTEMSNVDGIKGTGFNPAAQSMHEYGRYFATDPDTAEFYEYKGNAAVSTVVVAQNPLVLDWRGNVTSDFARAGEFREAALEAAGIDPDAVIYDEDLSEFRAADSAEDTTTLLKAAGYDSVSIFAHSGGNEDPTTGGDQLIVFDREQAVVIGTETVPSMTNDPTNIWRTYYSEEDQALLPTQPEQTAPREVWERYWDEVDTWQRTHPNPEAEALARAFAKDFTPSLHPRNPDGTFRHAGGITAGATEVGYDGNEKMAGAFTDFIDRANQAAGVPADWSSEAPAQAKIQNIKEIGSALAARSEDDPALAYQLSSIGKNLLSVTVGLSLGEDGLTTGTAQYYQADHLHLTEGMTAEEVGGAQVAAKLQDTWMESASDTEPFSWALQLAIGRRFGVDMGAVPREMIAEPLKDGENLLWGLDPGSDARDLARTPAVKAYVDEVYSRTQKLMADRGVSEVTVYRGVHLKDWLQEGEQPVTMNPTASFTLDRSTAVSFSRPDRSTLNSYVLSATVPADRMFSTAMSGPGCLHETEFLVLGGPDVSVKVEAP